MRNLCMVVSYDGTKYFGFQTQPDGNTIQDRIEESIFRLTGEKLKITASGRTDAGVHARGQVFNFYTESVIPIERWCLALNNRLPDDIVILRATEVSEAFHSRRTAKKKTYCYTINANRYPDVFHQHLQFHHPTRLNVEEMQDSLKHLVGEHDFTSFASRKSTKESHVRTIYEARLVHEVDHTSYLSDQLGILKLYVTGNGFLHNMVRIIVGTLLKVGEGKWSSHDMLRILEGKDRSLAGPTAVAQGLMLWEVFYEEI
ncbi:tRNA pseudouridine synthase A [Paenibacillus swuensis]|uniref:tRNA pseudouridine synthase A n=1 Tax=Paenibacillus swuensis TaxID=1178515 RepID=A0A172TIE3_9BACL|nr:tRNA pseudouridine(38-40) synthase TruA [Paenibacillus swuensis]ANE46811.1 tRNA pseudouridine synthase A [Paenibacillus swuensis]